MKKLGILENPQVFDKLINQDINIINLSKDKNIDNINNLKCLYNKINNNNHHFIKDNTENNVISLMSYNIHKGKSFFMRKNVLPELKNVINKLNTDIVLLQEVRDFNLKDFKKNYIYQTDYLANNYDFASYGKNSIYSNGTGHHGNSILSKYPALQASNFSLTLGNLEQRGLLYNKIIVNNKTIHIFCTHLNLRKKDRFSQIKIMENFIEKIVINKEEAIIIAGDFNDFDGSIEQYFEKLNFQSVQQEQTFPNIYPIFNLDKIFIKNLTLIETNVYKDKSLFKLSDHLPVLAKFKI